jgi:biopolymer transport protein ExbB
MISTFQAITVFGTGEPKVMAGGISEALITTQIGLGVAVPIMFLHHLLDRRVDKIIGEIEEKGAAFSLLVLSRQDQEGKDANVGLDQEKPETAS